MKINLAHIRERATSGGWIDFVVFEAKSAATGESGNANLLALLTKKSRALGLKVDQSALAYSHNGRIQYYGTKSLVDYLSRSSLPKWTHEIDI
ncbi:hypothetical protein [Methylomonas sp. AM2-LC]|uniref:hypothetical protein n=1 Tax=Methylomonas sp. AM2-LC TaxID=3153301 RepID=UPI003265F7B3